MFRKFLIGLTFVLASCASGPQYPDYSELASQVVPSNVQLLGTFTNWRTGETKVDAVFCSGYVVSETEIYTAGHCVDSREVRQENGQIKVRLYDGRVVLADVVKFSFSEVEGKDTALLLVKEGGLTKVAKKGDAQALKQGEQVAIVGNTFGELVNSFTVGVVSYMNRKLEVGVFHQTDSLAGPGNSGGPVFNMKGELIGMLTRGGGGVSLFIPLDVVEAELAKAVHVPFDKLRFKAKRNR